MENLLQDMCSNIKNAIEVDEQIKKFDNYVFIGSDGTSHLYQTDIINPEKISSYFIWNQKNKQFRTLSGQSVDISEVKNKIIGTNCVMSHMFSRYLLKILIDAYQIKSKYGHSNFIDITHKNWRGVNLLSASIHKENIDNIIYAYNTFGDDDSRKVLYNAIAFRITRNPKVLKTSIYKQYFHSMIYPLKNATIIEGGAFNGNSSLEFFAKSEKTSTIYAYEPDFSNYLQALRNIHNNKATSNIFLINNGLSDKVKILKFSSDLQSSYVNETGDSYIFCSSIDDLVNKIDIKPTHIKLDIEGEENNALLGAKRTILTYKPKLLISAYHKPEDLWCLLQTIQSFRDDYKFALGFHSDAFTIYEIILYCY